MSALDAPPAHDTSLCHGRAGVLHITTLMARDSHDRRLTARLPALLSRVLDAYDPAQPFGFRPDRPPLPGSVSPAPHRLPRRSPRHRPRPRCPRTGARTGLGHDLGRGAAARLTGAVGGVDRPAVVPSAVRSGGRSPRGGRRTPGRGRAVRRGAR
ncbi:hypothetical protein [Kitasatospora griseola]|uniref:hypothetical protein n=1 Tax=Kitasatospora griseola TaxID=2064 RepID=UPI00380E46F7